MLASGKVVINGIYMNLRGKLTPTNDLKKMGFSWIVSPLISGLLGAYNIIGVRSQPLRTPDPSGAARDTPPGRVFGNDPCGSWKAN